MTSDAASPDMLLLGVILAVSVMVVALMGGVLYALGEPRRRLKRRIAGMGLERAVTSDGMTGGDGEPQSRQKRIQDKLRELESEKEKRAKRRTELRSSLLRAGLKINRRTYVITVTLAGLAATGLTTLMGFSPLVSGLAGMVTAVGVPKLVLTLMARSRQKRFTAEFPNAIDVLVRGVRSGLPVSECLRIVGRELPDPVGEEFRILVDGQRLGMSLQDIMDRAIERIPTVEFRFFSVVLQIQQQTGGNLGDTLSNLSTVLRERKKMRDKVKAVSSEARVSAMIIGSMPILFFGLVYLIAPDYMSLMLTDVLGHYMLVAGLLWMAIGATVMKVMTDFKM